jgi:hypothetical protein
MAAEDQKYLMKSTKFEHVLAAALRSGFKRGRLAMSRDFSSCFPGKNFR